MSRGSEHQKLEQKGARACFLYLVLIAVVYFIAWGRRVRPAAADSPDGEKFETIPKPAAYSFPPLPGPLNVSTDPRCKFLPDGGYDRFFNSEAYRRELSRADGDNNSPSLATSRSIVCPSGVTTTNESSRYENYALSGCEKGDNWSLDVRPVHKCIVATIGKYLKMKPNDLVLDWGAGCGHKLAWMSHWFGVHGFGLDLSSTAAGWAKNHSQSMVNYCVGDATNLSYIPPNTFDFAISYASLLHLPAKLRCQTVQELIRVVKPGGKFWDGWNRFTNAKYDGMTCENWKTCLAGLELEHAASLELCENEISFFGMTPYDWPIHNTIVIRKEVLSVKQTQPAVV